MKKKSFLLAAPFLAFSCLIGCINLDLYLQSPPEPPSRYEGIDALITCDDAWGGSFSGFMSRQTLGPFMVNLLELGANPIALPYDCKVSVDGCCTRVSIDGEDLFQELALTLICGITNPCVSPY